MKNREGVPSRGAVFSVSGRYGGFGLGKYYPKNTGGTPMFDRSKLPPDAKAYFDTLPALLQETLIQSGVDLRTKAELEQYCDTVLSKH